MIKDANGQEITIGCRVKHLHDPVPFGDFPTPGSADAPRHHNFFGASTAVGFFGGGVEVEKTHKAHIPFHLPSNLVVIS